MHVLPYVQKMSKIVVDRDLAKQPNQLKSNIICSDKLDLMGQG